MRLPGHFGESGGHPVTFNSDFKTWCGVLHRKLIANNWVDAWPMSGRASYTLGGGGHIQTIPYGWWLVSPAIVVLLLPVLKRFSVGYHFNKENLLG